MKSKIVYFCSSNICFDVLDQAVTDFNLSKILAIVCLIRNPNVHMNQRLPLLVFTSNDLLAFKSSKMIELLQDDVLIETNLKCLY